MRLNRVNDIKNFEIIDKFSGAVYIIENGSRYDLQSTLNRLVISARFNNKDIESVLLNARFLMSKKFWRMYLMNEVRRRIAARVYLLTILLVIIVVLIFSFISTNKHFVGAQPIKFALIIQVIIPIILGLPSIYIIKKYKLYQDSILGFKMFDRDFY